MPTETPLDPGLKALRTHSVATGLPNRGALVLAGPDCAELVHGLVTNDVKGLVPGSGCHAALLTPKGRMRAEMIVLRTDEGILLDCEPALAGPLVAILSGYVPFSRSTLEDRSETSGIVHVEGPGAVAVLDSAGVGAPPAVPFSHRPAKAGGTVVRVARVSRAGEEGFDLRVDRDDAAGVLELLAAHGARPAAPEVLEAGRIEAGIPRWGAELDESVLPNEAWLERTAISYSKGCYLGQETIARLKTYGHVNRHLVAILLPLASGSGPGGVVRAGETAVGNVTSAVDSVLRGRRVALAFVKREHEAPGTVLLVDTPSGAVEGVVAAVPIAG